MYRDLFILIVISSKFLLFSFKYSQLLVEMDFYVRCNSYQLGRFLRLHIFGILLLLAYCTLIYEIPLLIFDLTSVGV